MDGYFYFFVWSVGVIIFLIVEILYKINRIDKFMLNLFWIGFALGLFWELPLSIANELGICCGYPFPPATFEIPTPVQGPLVVIIITITHSFWDGGLFLLCVFFMYLLTKKPHFEKYKWSELGILVLVGQIQELIVELVSTTSNGWYYNLYWFNPPLFPWMGHYITLLPQIIWFIAPIVFYLIIIKYKTKLE